MSHAHNAPGRARLARLSAATLCVATFCVLTGQALGTGPLSGLKAGATVVAGASSSSPSASVSGMGGTITRIDRGAHSFTLKTDISPSVGESGKSYAVLTSPTTKFVSTTGKAESFRALKVGEHVGIVGQTTKRGFLAMDVSIRLTTSRRGGTTTAGGSGSTTAGGSNGSITEGTKLPAGFPKAVPLPARSTLVAEVSTGSKFYDLWFVVTGGQASVLNAYKGALGKAGFRITSWGGVVGSAMGLVSTSSSWDVTATVLAAGTVAGVPKGDLKPGQVEVVLVVT